MSSAKLFYVMQIGKKKVDLLGKKCVRVRREDTRSLYTHTLHIHKKDERNNRCLRNNRNRKK